GASTTPLLIGGALLTLFTGLDLAAIASGLRSLRGMAAPEAPAALSNSGPEAGKVVFSCLSLVIVTLAASQLVPVSHDNPPVQQAVQWDSPQTQQLARRACMDCHSSETRWPWYSYVAPASWLTSLHVHAARQQFNLSDLGSLPEFRK